MLYSNGTTYQSVATFSCNTGYTISTSITRTCEADKTWSHATPACYINGKLTLSLDRLLIQNKNISYLQKKSQFCFICCICALCGSLFIFPLPSRKHAYIILTPQTPLLYSKTGVYRGIHYFSYF